MPNRKRKQIEGPGIVGKTVVAGAKDRATNRVSARVIETTDKPELQGFVRDTAAPGGPSTPTRTDLYTIPECPNSTTKRQALGQRVRRDMAHTNGIESFWAMLKHGYQGTFLHFSEKHMQRYVNEFALQQGLREHDTIDLMGALVARMIGRCLTYSRLIGS